MRFLLCAVACRGVSLVRDAWDDEQLLAALREAEKARQAVPAEFVQAARTAYAWHNIDTELADLTYDSQRDEGRAVIVRSETASVRALTFTSASVTIELEVTGHCVLGQVSPAREGTIEAQTTAGAITIIPVDEIGCFAVDPKPTSPFRLRCRTLDGADVMTGWIML
jgi:hypothetical protein